VKDEERIAQRGRIGGEVAQGAHQFKGGAVERASGFSGGRGVDARLKEHLLKSEPGLVNGWRLLEGLVVAHPEDAFWGWKSKGREARGGLPGEGFGGEELGHIAGEDGGLRRGLRIEVFLMPPEPSMRSIYPLSRDDVACGECLPGFASVEGVWVTQGAEGLGGSVRHKEMRGQTLEHFAKPRKIGREVGASQGFKAIGLGCVGLDFNLHHTVHTIMVRDQYPVGSVGLCFAGLGEGLGRAISLFFEASIKRSQIFLTPLESFCRVPPLRFREDGGIGRRASLRC
jgi:hypothetical protein